MYTQDIQVIFRLIINEDNIIFKSIIHIDFFVFKMSGQLTTTVTNHNYLIGSNIAVIIMILLVLPLTIASGLYIYNYGSTGKFNLKSGGAKILGILTLIIPILFFIIAIIVFLVSVVSARKEVKEVKVETATSLYKRGDPKLMSNTNLGPPISLNTSLPLSPYAVSTPNTFM